MRKGHVVLLLALVSVIGSILVGCGHRVELPEYAHRKPNGSVLVDVVEASGGSAYLDERGWIIYEWGDYKTEFIFAALSAKGGLSTRQLPAPPLKISPLITPDDGVRRYFRGGAHR